MVAAVALAVLAAAPPAHAVVAGTRARLADSPWIVALPGCTGTLVTPDRVLTAGHCEPPVGGPAVVGTTSTEIEAGEGVLRRVGRVARHPRYSENDHYGGTASYDLLVAELDQPVRSVSPVALADPAAPAPPGTATRIIGFGAVGLELDRSRRDGDGMPLIVGTRGGGALRSAPLELVDAARCSQELSRGSAGAGREYLAGTMLCGVDPDRAAPYRSSCLGDSGGPLVIGAGADAVQIGVTSWTLRCGQLTEPSIEARVDIWRDAILSPRGPVWAPRVSGRPVLRGRIVPGATVRCDGSRVRILGRPFRRRYIFLARGRPVRSRTPTYRVRTADRGSRLRCRIEASNEGGEDQTAPSR